MTNILIGCDALPIKLAHAGGACPCSTLTLAAKCAAVQQRPGLGFPSIPPTLEKRNCRQLARSPSLQNVIQRTLRTYQLQLSCVIFRASAEDLLFSKLGIHLSLTCCTGAPDAIAATAAAASAAAADCFRALSEMRRLSMAVF